MTTIKKMTKSTLLYFFGTVSSRLIGFLLIPIYTRFLDPLSYGYYDLLIAYVSFGLSILFLDIWNGVLRFLLNDDSSDNGSIIKNGLVIFSISSLLFIIFIVILNIINPIASINIYVIVLYGLTTNLVTFFSYIARGLGRNLAFVISGIVSTVISAIINIVLIVKLGLGIESLFISSIVANISSLFILGKNIDLSKTFQKSKYDTNVIKKLLLFSLPLSLNSASYWFLTSYSKVIISNNLGYTENGYYAITGKFASILMLFASAISLAWQEVAFGVKGDNKDKSSFFNQAINKYIVSLVLVLSIVLPSIKIIFPYLVDPSYQKSLTYLPLYMVGTFMSILCGVLASILGNVSKNKYILYSSLAGAIVNVVLLHITIEKLQVIGAALSIAIGYTIVFMLRYLSLQKIFRLRLDYKNIIFSLSIITFTMIFYYKFDTIMNLLSISFAILVIIFYYKNDLLSLVKKVLR